MLEIKFGKIFVQPLSLCLGFFDCAHIGHREVIAAAARAARETSSLLSAFTFVDDPLAVKMKNKGGSLADVSGNVALGGEGSLILTYPERVRRLAELDVAVVISTAFGGGFGRMSAKEFFDRLSTVYYLKSVTVGEDFRFGRDASGDVDDLGRFCKKAGILLNLLPFKRTADGEKVSSTLARKLLQNGDIERANELLGAPYFLSGVVERGLGKGANIGFCTANIPWSKEKMRIRRGVYKTVTIVDGISYRSITNVGVCPSVDGGRDYHCESHVFGNDGSLRDTLYGKQITVEFHAFIRDEREFASKSELSEQIARDIEICLER